MPETEPRPPDAGHLTSLLPYAILAPSSHNTQPWRFEVSRDSVHIYADRERALPVNDPDDRELVISCGAALCNLRLAAGQAGLAVTVKMLPHGPDNDLLAVIERHPGEGKVNDAVALFQAIPARRTCRGAFIDRSVPGEIGDALIRAAEEEGAWLEAIHQDDSRLALASLVETGDQRQWADPAWRRELAAWLRPRSTGDGLTVPGLVTPIARFVISRFNLGKSIGKKDRQLAEKAPLLAVLGTASDSVGDRLVAGQALQRVLLTACTHDLQASYLNQPIQVSSLRQQIRDLTQQDGFPQIILRLGYPEKQPPPAPRRRLEGLPE